MTCMPKRLRSVKIRDHLEAQALARDCTITKIIWLKNDPRGKRYSFDEWSHLSIDTVFPVLRYNRCTELNVTVHKSSE